MVEVEEETLFWEVELVIDRVTLLKNYVLQVTGNDKWIWSYALEDGYSEKMCIIFSLMMISFLMICFYRLFGIKLCP